MGSFLETHKDPNFKYSGHTLSRLGHAVVLTHLIFKQSTFLDYTEQLTSTSVSETGIPQVPDHSSKPIELYFPVGLFQCCTRWS